jgi:hypothetical protein
MRFQRSLTDINTITYNRDENPFIDMYESHLFPFIVKQDVDLIGISITFGSQLIPSLTLARLIKSYNIKSMLLLVAML